MISCTVQMTFVEDCANMETNIHVATIVTSGTNKRQITNNNIVTS